MAVEIIAKYVAPAKPPRPRKPNPMDEVVAALIAAGEDAAVTLSGLDKREFDREVRLFREAADFAGKRTRRQELSEDELSGVYVLRDKKVKPDAESEDADSEG